MTALSAKASDDVVQLAARLERVTAALDAKDKRLAEMIRERDAALARAEHAEVQRSRGLVQRAATLIEHAVNRLDDDVTINECCAWLYDARALLDKKDGE